MPSTTQKVTLVYYFHAHNPAKTLEIKIIGITTLLLCLQLKAYQCEVYIHTYLFRHTQW